MSSDMSVKVTRTIAELNQVEQGLVIDKVDPRIIAQFHDAVEHLRQTAWSVVQWVELNSSGGDPFEVLPQLEAERMHMLRKLAHNVTADLDSGSVTRFTEGISKIYEEVAGALPRTEKDCDRFAGRQVATSRASEDDHDERSKAIRKRSECTIPPV